MAGLAEAMASAWHALPAVDAARELDVDPPVGLSSVEAARRLERYGPNRLDEVPREPRWRVFLRQFQNLLIVILLIAAVVSLIVTREWETPVVIVLVVLLNATIGFVQESRAEASLEALRQMLVTTATVRRDGSVVHLDAGELVPGDVVVVEAGDRVPADGRLLSATSLEVQESALTGEAQAVGKSAFADVDPQAPLGDRTTAVFMNTTVTRGRGEVLVTATGMQTETGRIAHMLHEAEPEPTPFSARSTPWAGPSRSSRAPSSRSSSCWGWCVGRTSASYSSARSPWRSQPFRRGCRRSSPSPWPCAATRCCATAR